jgi:D-inositol-3-phosphate glycosyltransferase
VRKILLVGPAHPYRGGIADLNERLAASLKAGGDEAEILSFSLQYPSFLFPGKSQTSEGDPPENIRIWSSINSVNPFNWILTGLRFRKKKYDLILFRYWLPFFGPAFGTIARLLKRKNNKILVITDNAIPHEKRPGDRMFSKYFFSACDGFVCMAGSVKNDLRSLGVNKPISVTPHPVYDVYGKALSHDEALKQLNLDPAFNYILFFGFIRKYKGLDLLLEAFARLEMTDVKLIVAGEYYEDPAPYEQLIDRLGIRDRIISMNHFIEDAKVPALFCSSNLLVQPYRSATQSGVAQIAYYYNLPMVVSRVGGLAEIVPHGKTGYCVEPAAAPIAEAINTYFRENKESAFRENMLKEKERFSWPVFIDAINQLSIQA